MTQRSHNCPFVQIAFMLAYLQQQKLYIHIHVLKIKILWNGIGGDMRCRNQCTNGNIRIENSLTLLWSYDQKRHIKVNIGQWSTACPKWLINQPSWTSDFSSLNVSLGANIPKSVSFKIFCRRKILVHFCIGRL